MMNAIFERRQLVLALPPLCLPTISTSSATSESERCGEERSVRFPLSDANRFRRKKSFSRPSKHWRRADASELNAPQRLLFLNSSWRGGPVCSSYDVIVFYTKTACCTTSPPLLFRDILGLAKMKHVNNLLI